MQYSISLAVAALISNTAAIKMHGGPDVYGPNGENYDNTSPSQEMADIGISIHEKGSGDKCTPGDWTTVHWTGYLKDGRMVTDSRSEPGGLPKIFALGASEVFKCWDLALTQLHKGDKAHVTCPSHYVWGGAYTQSPLGGDPIPLHSDVDFDLEVVDCNRQPEKKFLEPQTQPVTTTMQPGRCMWLHFLESENTAYDLVLSAQEDDYSSTWPGKYVFLEHREKEDESQQWYYDETTGALHNGKYPSYTLGLDHDWVMVADWARGRSVNHLFPSASQWYYDPVTMALTTNVDGTEVEVTVLDDHPIEWSWVRSISHNHSVERDFSKFRIEYCWKNF